MEKERPRENFKHMFKKQRMIKLKKILSSKHGLSVITQFGASFIALISFMILARTFAKENFGQWVLYLSLITFVDMIKSGMVQSAYIKYASGMKGSRFMAFQGSSWVLNIIATMLVSVLTVLVYFLDFFEMEGVLMFLLFYPIYAICSMPFNYYLWNSQIQMRFDKVAKGRVLNAFLFLIVCVLSLFMQMTVFELVVSHSISFFSISLFLIAAKQSGIRSITSANKKDLKKYWNFGKFHSLAFLGSNLLKSSDTFLIGGFLGPVFVAVYSIPLRLVELIEMPLKGAVSVAYPVFSAHHNKEDLTGLRASLEQYIGVLTLLYVPFMLSLYWWSDELVALVGGAAYSDTGNIFRIFLIYGLFLPFDRLTGIVLDATGKPRLNFYKVFIMAAVNIIGDVIALYFFNSLEIVALITIGNVIAGMMVGYYLSKKELNISVRSIFQSGFTAIIKSINQLKVNKL